MARPKKNNAEYFAHDADMRNDIRIKALRRKFPDNVGYSLWNMLLEVLTDSDYFEIELDDMAYELLSADFDVEAETLRDVVNYCITLGLLKNDNNKLYSESHQKRFKALLSKRQRDNERITDNENKSEIQNLEVIASENPYSKVKYSKVEETKVNKNKISLSKDGNPERENFLEVFFFYHHLKSSVLNREIDRFINHYQGIGWVNSKGVSIQDRIAVAQNWTCKENLPKNDPEFIKIWYGWYQYISERSECARLMITDFGGCNYKATGNVQLLVSEPLMKLLEEHIQYAKDLKIFSGLSYSVKK